MSLIATVLYEDSMLPNPSGSYPLHDLVMRFVEDDINGETWTLRGAVRGNPRNGIGNILNDLSRTALLAGKGHLFVLMDRDKIARHLQLPANENEENIVTELKNRSDAPDRLHLFFLEPNVEGLLRSIQNCDPMLLPDNLVAALQKKLNDRDIVFNEVKKASYQTLRDCVRSTQPGLDGLVKAIAQIIP